MPSRMQTTLIHQTARRFIFYSFMAVKTKKQNPKSNPFPLFVYDVFTGACWYGGWKSPVEWHGTFIVIGWSHCKLSALPRPRDPVGQRHTEYRPTPAAIFWSPDQTSVLLPRTFLRPEHFLAHQPVSRWHQFIALATVTWHISRPRRRQRLTVIRQSARSPTTAVNMSDEQPKEQTNGTNDNNGVDQSNLEEQVKEDDR